MDIEKFFSIEEIRKSWELLDTKDSNQVDDEVSLLIKKLKNIIYSKYNIEAINIILDELDKLFQIRFSSDWNKLNDKEQLEIISKIISLLNNIEDLIDSYDINV